MKSLYDTCKSNIFHFVTKLGNVSLSGFLYYLKLRLSGKTIIVTGSCNGCGTCCRSISLESEGGWLRSEKKFRRIVEDFPKYSRFEITGRDEQGFLLFSCTWVTPEGICRDYENRLPLCSAFPESSLVFAGGKLPPNCGYSFSEVVPFDKVLKNEIKKMR